jgi:hypothetical protein
MVAMRSQRCIIRSMNNTETNQGGWEIAKPIKFLAAAAIGALAVKFLPNVLNSDLVDAILQDPGSDH